MLTGKRLILCKEAKISVRLQLGPCAHRRTNRNRSFSVLKKKEEAEEENDNIDSPRSSYYKLIS
jgi:hypothetical protein